MSATNGTMKFLFIITYAYHPEIDIIRSDHEPTPEEINEVVGKCSDRVFDPADDAVTRYHEDCIVTLPPKPH